MKKLVFLSVLSLAAVTLTFAGKKKKKKSCEATCEVKQAVKLNNEADSLNYAIGILMGDQIKTMPFDTINPELVKQGLDGAFNNDTIMDVDQSRQFLDAYMRSAQEREAKKAKKEGADFLAKNAQREGVTTTESGLQYEIVKESFGAKPLATNQVTVHYRGTLIDGTVFDSSYDRGQPATFGLNQVIKGWTEGVQLMSVGSVYKFYIPYELGYGERGTGQSIPGYSTLIFDVELLEIK